MMNKTNKLVTLMILSVTLFSTVATANINKGQSIYTNNLKVSCGFSGATFAHNHTQDQWESIYQSGKFAYEVNKICPKVKIENKHVKDMYDFAYEYAKDSGNIPSY